MKTNKIFTIGIVALAALMTTSCKDSFLEVENPTDYPVEDYYRTKKHLDEALVAAYAPLHWFDYGTTSQYNALGYMGEFMADDMLPNGSSNSDQPSLQAMCSYTDLSPLMVPTGLWSDGYSGVKRANDAIKYADWTEEAGEITAVEKADYVSQLRVLRAFYYDILWKFYGNIPCYFTNLEPPYIDEQLSADDVYAKVIADLEDVIDNGDLKDEYPTEEAGHVTKPMAKMLYTEMVMIQNDNSRYGKALNYLQSIISSGQFDLVSDFSRRVGQGKHFRDQLLQCQFRSCLGQCPGCRRLGTSPLVWPTRLHTWCRLRRGGRMGLRFRHDRGRSTLRPQRSPQERHRVRHGG